MNESGIYFMKPPIGLPKAAKMEILEVIDRLGSGGVDESMYSEIQSILNKYGFLLVTDPELVIKRNPELQTAI